jgi:hypothetical protein
MTILSKLSKLCKQTFLEIILVSSNIHRFPIAIINPWRYNSDIVINTQLHTIRANPAKAGDAKPRI